MLSADCPDGRGEPGRACGDPVLPARPGPTRDAPRSPSPSWVCLSGGERETPAGFRSQRPGSVCDRGCRGVWDQLMRRGVREAPSEPGAFRARGRGRPDTAVVFWGRERYKINSKSDRVCVARGFAPCVFPGKNPQTISPLQTPGREGLKPHGRNRKRQKEMGPRSPPDVQPLLSPQSWAGPLRPLSNPPAPFRAHSAERGEGRAVRLGQLARTQSFVICSPE